MQIEIKHCNNVDNGTIEIKENTLNIKYAINGTGKSTIAKAILAAINDRKTTSNSLKELTPFKHRNSKKIFPEVIGIDNISNIKIFDEKYIIDTVFQPEELLKGSFDVFIRSEDYEKGMKDIDSRLEKINLMLSKDKDISDLVNDFNDIMKWPPLTRQPEDKLSSNMAG